MYNGFVPSNNSMDSRLYFYKVAGGHATIWQWLKGRQWNTGVRMLAQELLEEKLEIPSLELTFCFQFSLNSMWKEKRFPSLPLNGIFVKLASELVPTA